jgi:hypothetical protein
MSDGVTRCMEKTPSVAGAEGLRGTSDDGVACLVPLCILVVVDLKNMFLLLKILIDNISYLFDRSL